MDGFTGFKSATAEELPGARAVMDPFHVVHLAGDALDECCRRTGQELRHRRGRATDPLIQGPQNACTPDLACSRHASSTNYSTCFPVRSTSRSRSLGAPTRTSPGAYRDPNKIRGKALMQAEIACLSDAGVPRSLTQIVTLGRTLKRRAGDILAYIKPPPHHRRPYRSHQRPPRTPTRIRPRTSVTSPTTSPEHSSKPENSDPNYTPNYEEPPKGAGHCHGAARNTSHVVNRGRRAPYQCQCTSASPKDANPLTSSVP